MTEIWSRRQGDPDVFIRLMMLVISMYEGAPRLNGIHGCDSLGIQFGM